MSRLVGLRSTSEHGWEWFVVEDEQGHRRPRPWLIAPLVVAVAAVIAVAVGLSSHGVEETAAHAPSGAIFTTEADGDPVNANIYNNKHKVHLNGGPPLNAPPDAAGLDDGDYYFQITDPSGAVLLSSDFLKCRRIRVANGVIIGSVKTDGSLNNTSVNNNSNSTPCPHHVHDDDTKAAALDARTVHLMPYDDTPNPGGVYKVWVTPVGDLLCADDPNTITTCEVGRFHGFDPGHTKTDNFKVKGGPRGSISGVKWYDADADGVFDAAEDPVAGWPIKVCNVGLITQSKGGGFNIPNVDDCETLFTDSNGAYTLTNLRGSTYCVREALARDVDSDPGDPDFNTFDWEQTYATDHSTSFVFAAGCTHNDPGFDADLMNGIHEVTLSAGQAAIDINFGNVALEQVPFVSGLTWGYWKTHTGTDASPPEAPQDLIYGDGISIDLGESGATHLDVDSPEDADLVFAADGSVGEPSQPLPGEIQDLCSAGNDPGDCRADEFDPPADCSGDCHELFTAQLLALKLNCLKFAGMCDAVYINPGHPFSGMTVNEIIAIADGALTGWFNGGSFDFGSLLATIDTINNNASSDVLFSLAPLPSPPSPLCFVGFSGLPSATGLPVAFICP